MAARDCGICLEAVDAAAEELVQISPCGHIQHTRCQAVWESLPCRKKDCPTCLSAVTGKEYISGPPAVTDGEFVSDPAAVIDDCSICFEGLVADTKTLACSHVFHELCIDKWAASADTCPICRARIVGPVPEVSAGETFVTPETWVPFAMEPLSMEPSSRAPMRSMVLNQIRPLAARQPSTDGMAYWASGIGHILMAQSDIGIPASTRANFGAARYEPGPVARILMGGLEHMANYAANRVIKRLEEAYDHPAPEGPVSGDVSNSTFGELD